MRVEGLPLHSLGVLSGVCQALSPSILNRRRGGKTRATAVNGSGVEGITAYTDTLSSGMSRLLLRNVSSLPAHDPVSHYINFFIAYIGKLTSCLLYFLRTRATQIQWTSCLTSC